MRGAVPRRADSGELLLRRRVRLGTARRVCGAHRPPHRPCRGGFAGPRSGTSDPPQLSPARRLCLHLHTRRDRASRGDHPPPRGLGARHHGQLPVRDLLAGRADRGAALTRRAAASPMVLTAAMAWWRAEVLMHGRIGPQPLLDSLRRLSDAVLNEALNRNEKSQLTQRIYDASPIYPALVNELFPFEQALFTRDLPDPPARVLVGGCGAGREVIALA